jgi:hypothetical protein
MATLSRFASTFDLSGTATSSKLRMCFQLLRSQCSPIFAVSSCCGVGVLNCRSTTDALRGSMPVASKDFLTFSGLNDVVQEAQKSGKKSAFLTGKRPLLR